MRLIQLISQLLLLVLFASSCGGASEEVTKSATDSDPKTVASITASQLLEGFEFLSPAMESVFVMPESAGASDFSFEGRLILNDVATQGEITYISGSPVQELEHLPAFDFSFIQTGNDLVPTQRGLIITSHPVWNYILEPGHVWQETASGNYSRASFPFALTVKGGNSTYNGTMLFVFNDTEISNVWYQITQETAIGTKINMWGLLDATYQKQTVRESARIISEFELEKQNKFPTKNISSLSVDYPQIDISQFGSGLTKTDRTLYGIVVNGVNYTSPCHTRYGDYYYCQSMRFPSYSTSKSAFAGVALMRLAESFEPAVEDILIKDYVPETSGATGNWEHVSFGHTLDMATGNYESSSFMVDEEQFGTHSFFTETYYDERMAGALNWPNSGSPGVRWVYHTSDTFVVTRAMQNYLQELQGLETETDIFEFVVDEVYKPIKMGPGVFSTSRTQDNNWQGQAFGGYGLWWTSDDLAKITTLLNVENGKYAGEQILNLDLLSATMQRDPSDRGVTINSREKYNNGFWATQYGAREGFECEFWVTEMLGFSGIVVVMMPNGSSYYYASDNREFTWLDAVRESNRISPHCQQ